MAAMSIFLIIFLIKSHYQQYGDVQVFTEIQNSNHSRFYHFCGLKN